MGASKTIQEISRRGEAQDKSKPSKPVARETNCWASASFLPIQFPGQEFVDQVFVEWAQFLDVGLFVALGVKIVGIKRADPVEHLAVLIVHQVIVLAFAMTRIKGMVTKHVEGFLRHAIL